MYRLLAEITSARSVFSRLDARALRSLRVMTLVCFFMAVVSAPTPGASSGRAAARNRHDDRVISLLIEVANQAQFSSYTSFAVRVQAQAGLLLWPYDRDQARAILRRAFQPLLRSPIDFQPVSALEAAKRQQLRVEVLNQIAGCDPEMAEALARSFALSPPAVLEPVSFTASEGVSPIVASQGRLETESRELLVSVALRLAEVHKHRAAALAQMSLGAGISPYFDRLLLRIGKGDQALADRLFCSAMDYLERSRRVSLDDVHTLSFYLVSAGGAADRDRVTQAAVVRFLDLACDVVMRGDEISLAETAGREATGQAFRLSSTARYLAELLPRYPPARSARLQARLARLAARQAAGPASDVRPTPPVHPHAIEQAARDSAGGRERDELYTRAAFAWLARAEFREAQRVAANVAGPEARDRVLLAVARRLVLKAYIKDALLIVPLVQDRVAKTDLLVRLAQTALTLQKTQCAKTLLDLAGLEAAKIEGPFARAQSLLSIVISLSASDPARAFVVMQEAVDSLNEDSARESQALDPAPSEPEPASAQTDDLFQSFASSLTTLARLDFDRALRLAQQLTDKEASLIAQLAVCRGGCDQRLHRRGERNER
ncbi:MAG TPA: hypothetical protein VJZ91_05900 [Blastocatellia bacterium]|nr:hypothetical protein [Blastocatellia bacterium]